MPDQATAAPAVDTRTIEAVLVLADPAGPGRPWAPEEIAAALPSLTGGPSTLDVEATTARWLGAIAAGEVPDEG